MSCNSWITDDNASKRVETIRILSPLSNVTSTEIHQHVTFFNPNEVNNDSSAENRALVKFDNVKFLSAFASIKSLEMSLMSKIL